MLRPYLPPHASAALADSPRQSVPVVLVDQGIGVDLRLRNRHQDVGAGALTRPLCHVLELPTGLVLAVLYQVISSIRLRPERGAAFLQDTGPLVPAGTTALGQ